MNLATKLLSLSLAIIFLNVACKDSSRKSPEGSLPNVFIDSHSLNLFRSDILSAKKEVTSAIDSLNFYKLSDLNDSCIKFLYALYHDVKVEKDTFRLELSRCSIRPAEVSRINKTTFRLRYITFLQDSVPGYPEMDTAFGVHFVPLMMDVDSYSKQPIQLYTGIYRLGDAKAFHKFYEDTLKSESFKNFIIENKNNFHPTFWRLFGSN